MWKQAIAFFKHMTINNFSRFSICVVMNFNSNKLPILATLVSLYFTPVSWWLGDSVTRQSFNTSVALRLASLFKVFKIDISYLEHFWHKTNLSEWSQKRGTLKPSQERCTCLMITLVRARAYKFILLVQCQLIHPNLTIENNSKRSMGSDFFFWQKG